VLLGILAIMQSDPELCNAFLANKTPIGSSTHVAHAYGSWICEMGSWATDEAYVRVAGCGLRRDISNECQGPKEVQNTTPTRPNTPPPHPNLRGGTLSRDAEDKRK